MLTKTLMLGLAAAAFLALGQVAFAQYPPPDGNVTLSPSDPVPDLGSTTKVTLAVVDNTGAAVPDTVCTAKIASQLGSTASLGQTSLTTGADGTATLDVSVGNSAGQVKIEIACREFVASIVLSAGAPNPALATSEIGRVRA